MTQRVVECISSPGWPCVPFQDGSAAFNPDLTCLKITFRLVSHIPPHAR